MRKDTNPNHWKLGVLYYNPDEPRLLVAKRFGGPFTLNLANPIAWTAAAILPAVAIAGLIAR